MVLLAHRYCAACQVDRERAVHIANVGLSFDAVSVTPPACGHTPHPIPRRRRMPTGRILSLVPCDAGAHVAALSLPLPSTLAMKGLAHVLIRV